MYKERNLLYLMELIQSLSVFLRTFGVDLDASTLVYSQAIFGYFVSRSSYMKGLLKYQNNQI